MMKRSYTSAILGVLSALLTTACAPVRVDPNVGPPTGVLTVRGKAGTEAETMAMIHNMLALALQYPRRPAFETAALQQIRTGEMKVDFLAITYADGSSRVFK